MDVRERVGLNLQRLRREKGLSQEELADLAGIHQTYLSGVERGKRNPTVAVLQRIAEALGADIEDLVQKAQIERKHASRRADSVSSGRVIWSRSTIGAATVRMPACPASSAPANVTGLLGLMPITRAIARPISMSNPVSTEMPRRFSRYWLGSQGQQPPRGFSAQLAVGIPPTSARRNRPRRR